ncbi:hypothetical protein LBMAG23_02130 [Bacteroidota bacterium]|nr:hypothetical protein LBMAG23_02130 [Bacteroidota bacterium]
MWRGMVLLSLLFFLPAGTFSWGFFAHRFINFHAVFLLPREMLAFYKSNIQYLSEHSVDPDKRRYILPEEAPRHYIDLDHFKQSDSLLLSSNWDKAVEQFSADTLRVHGIVPWWIQIVKANLTKAFAEKDRNAILKYSADIGHYIGDAHVPLHASSNHNGQLTNQLGIHGFWESRLPELFAAAQYDMLIDKAIYLKDPLAFIWGRIHQSAAAADTVLTIEKKLSDAMNGQYIFSYQKRNGKYERIYTVAYATRYHNALKGMVERRMRASTHAVASFWYTAWVDAGQPNLSEISHSK